MTMKNNFENRKKQNRFTVPTAQHGQELVPTTLFEGNIGGDQ